MTFPLQLLSILGFSCHATTSRLERETKIEIRVATSGEARRCTSSILCSSCYAPARDSCSSNNSSCCREETTSCREGDRSQGITPTSPANGKKLLAAPHDHVPCLQSPTTDSTPPLKSNLKKTIPRQLEDHQQQQDEKQRQDQEENEVLVVSRKVSWPDAHGKDLAHVLEFHPSTLEDGNLKGTTRSCICVIL